MIRGGHRGSVQGFKERQTVTGVFSTLIFDLKADSINTLQENDQETIRNQLKSQPNQTKDGFEQVDTIRFIKTNKIYYDRVMLLFLKFFSVNKI